MQHVWSNQEIMELVYFYMDEIVRPKINESFREQVYIIKADKNIRNKNKAIDEQHRDHVDAFHV